MPIELKQIPRFLTATPRRVAWLRFGVVLAIVTAIFAIIPHTPLDGPIGGVIALSLTLVCCWFGGPYPAAFVPLVIVVISRSGKDAPPFSMPTLREAVTFVTLTVLTMAVGLAGQYQRRWRRVWRQHQHESMEAERSLRESEERFRLLADSAPALIWINGPDGAEFVNRTYVDFLGVSHADVLGYGWAGFIHVDDRDSYMQAYLHAFDQRKSFSAEFRFRRHDGDYRWMRTVAQPRISHDGTFLGYAGISTDVTEQRAAEDALKDANRRKDEFLAMLAHELRNPLAPIANAAQVLCLWNNQSHKEVSWACEIVQRQVCQLTHIVDDLLDVSRITQGKIKLQRTPTDVAAIVSAAIETSMPLIASRGHRLHTELPSSPLVVHADLTRMVQVVTNLLNNAAKYTGEGGDIWLTCRRDGNDILVSVRDNGIGLSPEILPKVFDLFTQADRTIDRSQGGLGIGLTLVRSLMELHGGSVGAASEGLGRGSEFTVRLPLWAQAPSTVESAPPCSSSPARAADQRILVVDDNRDSAATLAHMLKTMGHPVQIAHDGRAALDEAAAFRPDLILLDIGLPILNGFLVAERLRSDPAHSRTVIAALTGYGDEQDRKRSTEAGIDHHLVKPLTFAVLQDLIETLPHGDGAR
jgi:PAS domain S-box-containing protein